MKQYEEEFLDKFGYKGLKIIAAYEDTMDLDYSDHYASWFGSYNMHVFSGRKEISFDQLRARYYKSLSLLGITTEQVDETCSHILTADLSTHIRNEKLRTVKTNVGEMPLEDYQEIRAAEIGYDSYAEMYAAGLRIGHGYDAMSVWERYKPFDFIRDTFTIGDDITLRARTEIIQASLAFNAEEIFGIHATPR